MQIVDLLCTAKLLQILLQSFALYGATFANLRFAYPLLTSTSISTIAFAPVTSVVFATTNLVTKLCFVTRFVVAKTTEVTGAKGRNPGGV